MTEQNMSEEEERQMQRERERKKDRENVLRDVWERDNDCHRKKGRQTEM